MFEGSQHLFTLCILQLCPDKQKYAAGVSNFCAATPKEQGTCVDDIYKKRPNFTAICRFSCLTDPQCTPLPFDHEVRVCACACQVSLTA